MQIGKTLFVSPHPDDVEIGCGGLVHMLTANFRNADIAICSGEGDFKQAHTGKTVKFSDRVKEQKAAARALGVDRVFWLGLAEASRFDQVPQSKFVTAFDDLFWAYDNIVLPLPSYNDDHKVVWHAALAALRPGRCDASTVYAYEQPFSNLLTDQLPLFGRTYFRLSERNLRAKKRAIACHHTQMNEREDSIYGGAAAEDMARLRGKEIGVPLAEVLYLLRQSR